MTTTAQAPGPPVSSFPETTVEQTDDGGFRRQRNHFPARFGAGPGRVPVEAGRYTLLGSPGCGWARRQMIVLRLLGIPTDVLGVELLLNRDEHGWVIDRVPGGVVDTLGVTRLNDIYRRTDPAFKGRGTSPSVVDLRTGTVVSNNYHTLSLDWETVWKPFHAPGAPDLYPEALRQEIDLLNQQIFDDINNGAYKVNFATRPGAARAARDVFYARLADYEFRLTSRRYLFGDQVTDSDVRLFQTLASFDRGYRRGFIEALGAPQPKISDFPNLWAYARDLLSQGFADDRELAYLGLLPGPDGQYLRGPDGGGDGDLPAPAEHLALWREPHGRGALAGSPYYTGPGGGGSFELWEFGGR
jgi:putative glutathione S-transferase